MDRCPCCAKQLPPVIDDAPFCWTCGLYASDPAGECDSPSHRPPVASDHNTDDLMDAGGLWHGHHAPIAAEDLEGLGTCDQCCYAGCTCPCHRPPGLTPSADVPACRDEDPAWSATLAACYPDPPEYQHPEDDDA